jgi:hypothetical protein
MHRLLCAALPALRLYIIRHGVEESRLEWTGVCREDSSKRVATALLLSCLIKRCLQTAHCAPSRFMDHSQRAKSLKLPLSLGGTSLHSCNLIPSSIANKHRNGLCQGLALIFLISCHANVKPEKPILKITSMVTHTEQRHAKYAGWPR